MSKYDCQKDIAVLITLYWMLFTLLPVSLEFLHAGPIDECHKMENF